jgi:hypothetical protein
VERGRNAEPAEQPIVHDILASLFEHVQQLVGCRLDAAHLEGRQFVGRGFLPIVVPCVEGQAARFQAQRLVGALVSEA